MNDVGTVAFVAMLEDANTGICLGRGGSFTTIAKKTETFTRFVSYALNNQDAVAYIATGESDVQGVFIGDGTMITAIADTRDTFEAFYDVGINNQGTVIFNARRRGEAKNGDHIGGVYLWDGQSIASVLTPGDTLFGRQGSRATAHAFNDAGQIAIFVYFDQPVPSLIVRADRMHLP